MSSYTRWYREGTVTTTAGGNTITGTNTYWQTAGLNPGDILKLGGGDYEIAEVTDDTHLKIAGSYPNTVTGSAYAIVRNFTATMPAKIASQVSGLLGIFSKYVDEDMQTLNGKSAYEVAVANGYEGSASEWLESLKAAGEWSTLDNRTAFLDATLSNDATHNSIYRGRNLGAHPTAAQYEAIRTGKFTDLYLGDYWGDWEIVDFNYYAHNIHDTSANIPVDPYTGEKRHPNNRTGDPYNHVVLRRRNGLGGQAYAYYDEDDKNEDGTFAGYQNCHYTRAVRPEVLNSAASVFGLEHLLEWSEYVPSGYSAEGIPSGHIELIMQCELPTFRMFTGSDWWTYESTVTHAAPSAYAGMNRNLAGIRQFSLDRLTPAHTHHWNVCRDILGLCSWSRSALAMPVFYRYIEGWPAVMYDAAYNIRPMLMLGSVSAESDHSLETESTEGE